MPLNDAGMYRKYHEMCGCVGKCKTRGLCVAFELYLVRLVLLLELFYYYVRLPQTTNLTR
jgi:hypothetical protein